MADIKRNMALLKQESDETLGKAWQRFKELVRSCDHHEYNQNLL